MRGEKYWIKVVRKINKEIPRKSSSKRPSKLTNTDQNSVVGPVKWWPRV